ncbi:hypothetical protein J41TS12_19840 [Paenibacillus antibioticophila]|uniref:Prolipoprotein diacylglyceryl transferase n=1 Tax=Paenibacillus antibioticophila TaxID=1274374 RepID=A0A920CGT3_9BACL|nr:hypothetical protein [Paenibacillus antibioticophila]GIO37123.1 hypothetical protein J41TS12_19840 [Paenibacillus antibioticophila]
MNNIQVGSLVLNGQLILYLAFGAAGWLMLRYRLRNMAERHVILSVMSNAFWMWIVVWKLSFLIFHPVEVIHRPAVLLYFDGGGRGAWIASSVAAFYIWKKAAKLKGLSPSWLDMTTLFLCSGWFAYQMLSAVIGVEPVWFHAASAGLTAGFLFLQLAFSSKSNLLKWPAYAVWLSIGHVILWFCVPNREILLLSFNKQQLYFLIIAAALTAWNWLNEARPGGGLRE